MDGTAELKDAIIAKFKRDNGLTYERNQILVSSGAKQTCFNVCAALLDPGDECVIPAPYWVSYPDMALLADGVPVSVYAGPEQGYKITAAQLAAAITPRSKLVFINSPSNPTGAAYTKAELQALGAVLDKHPQIVIASDEMYEHIYWAAEPFTSFVQANPAVVRPHGHHQRRVEGLCHDRLAHRLLRGTEGASSPRWRPFKASPPPMPRAFLSAPRPSL